MRATIAIMKREILSMFVSPVAYFVITGFVLLGAYFFFNLLAGYNLMVAQVASIPFSSGYPLPNLNEIVVQGFYQTLILTLVFLVPLLTMRIVAEERRRGTFELLVTSPISPAQIVIGKFLGIAFVLFVMLALATSFIAALCFDSSLPLEVPPVLSGFLGMFGCALSFAAVGLAVSSYTENQVVAGVTTMVILLLVYLINAPAELLGSAGKSILEYLSPVSQVGELIKGVVHLSSVVYFLSFIALGLFFSQRAIDGQRWR